MLCFTITVIAAVLCWSDVIGADIFTCAVLGSVILDFIGAVLYFKLNCLKFFYHDFLRWHVPDESDKFWHDGCSEHAICKHCHKEIMQDSQGNWFAMEEVE